MNSPDDCVARVLQPLQTMDDLELRQHPARYQAVHEGLQALLDGDQASAS